MNVVFHLNIFNIQININKGKHVEIEASNVWIIIVIPELASFCHVNRFQISVYACI